MKPSWTPPEDMGHRVVEFPDRPNVWIGAHSIEEFRRRYAAGDEEARSWVDESLAVAEKWSVRSDAWYLDTIWHREPRGIYTCACPIHPFRVRYYSYFDWSLEDPWRLYCPYCKAKRAANMRSIPTPGTPTTETAAFPRTGCGARTTTRPGAEAHDGIPWDHWDGEAHGYVEPTNAFYFKALCWMNSLRALSGRVLHRLGEASHAARLRSDPDTASKHARKARVILVTLARAFLGDAYLAALLETSETKLGRRLAGFYEPGTPAKTYPGYRLYAPFDHIEGDPERPLNAPGDRYGTKGASIYPGVWNWKASLAEDLLVGYSLIAGTFEESESDLKAVGAAHPHVRRRRFIETGGPRPKTQTRHSGIHPPSLFACHGRRQPFLLYPDAQAATRARRRRRPDHRKRGQRHILLSAQLLYRGRSGQGGLPLVHQLGNLGA